MHAIVDLISEYMIKYVNLLIMRMLEDATHVCSTGPRWSIVR